MEKKIPLSLWTKDKTVASPLNYHDFFSPFFIATRKYFDYSIYAIILAAGLVFQKEFFYIFYTSRDNRSKSIYKNLVEDKNQSSLNNLS